MTIWTLAKKDLRVLLRDPKAAVILLAMPLLFILVLGVSLGEGFGQKPDDRLRVSIVNLDRGPPRFFDRPAMLREGMGRFAHTPTLGPLPGGVAALTLAGANRTTWYPHTSWAQVVERDLRETAGIRVEVLGSLEEARDLIHNSQRAAVLVFGPDFSKRASRCSFLAGDRQEVLTFAASFPRPGLPVNLALAGLLSEGQDALPAYLLDGINPFYRDGIKLDTLDVQFLRDPTQLTAASIIEQVAQGTLVRVILPWMIGRAFEKIGDPAFLELLGGEEHLPGPVKTFLTSRFVPQSQKQALGRGLQSALQNLYPKYELTAKTWAALTRSKGRGGGGTPAPDTRELRYQILVPSYTVMFAFFLVLTVGWLFAGERRQGTLKRLRAAPLSRTQILLGKLLPCFLLSVAQGLFLLLAGRLVFGMDWGPQPLWLVPVVVTTSLAAMGLALLVAAVARTENQVALYGTMLVLLLAGISGSMMGDRALMPQQMQQISRLTPHAWALDAYRQLLTNPAPNYALVGMAAGVLAAFGLGFLLLAWWFLRLD